MNAKQQVVEAPQKDERSEFDRIGSLLLLKQNQAMSMFDFVGVLQEMVKGHHFSSLSFRQDADGNAVIVPDDYRPGILNHPPYRFTPGMPASYSIGIKDINRVADFLEFVWALFAGKGFQGLTVCLCGDRLLVDILRT